DALYVETHSLHQEGKYQWALIYIDPAGTVTRLPTPPKAPSRPASRHGNAPSHRESHPPTQSHNSRGKTSQLLGYCKLRSYVGGLDRGKFEEVGNAALSGRKDSVRPLWLLQVLATLQERGHILWNEP
ncbi:hypothetical protein V8E53_011455, partial [Lactarius tabidus]